MAESRHGMNPSDPAIPRGHLGVSAYPPLQNWVPAARKNAAGPSRIPRFGLDPSTARREAGFSEGLLVMSGHQPVLFHPGLWAKALSAGELAARIGGTALHKITDTDEPAAQDGWIPVRDRMAVRTEPAHLSVPGVPYAFQNAPASAEVVKLLETAAACGRPACADGVAAFFPRRSGEREAYADWDGWHEGALRSLDAVSGTSREYFRASFLWGLPSFRRFLALWVLSPERFCGAFNRALCRYRRERGISHPLAPVPDLAESGSWRETPFWTADRKAGRETLWVKTEGKEALLRSGTSGGEWIWRGDPDALSSTPWTLWPKALPQSLYSRLFLCDFFVHGLGGFVYEPANDLFLEELGEKSPPSFGAVTATLLIDPEVEPRYRQFLGDSLKAAAWRRVFEKNPEALWTRRNAWESELPESLRSLCGEASARPALPGWVQEKRSLLEALSDPARRSGAGKRIKELNAAMTVHLGSLWKAFDAFEKEIEAQQGFQGALAFREYAYFCYPPERYVDLTGKLRGCFEGG